MTTKLAYASTLFKFEADVSKKWASNIMITLLCRRFKTLKKRSQNVKHCASVVATLYSEQKPQSLDNIVTMQYRRCDHGVRTIVSDAEKGPTYFIIAML